MVLFCVQAYLHGKCEQEERGITMTTIDDQAMAHAQAVLAQIQDDWLQREGVTAVDLGFKWSQGAMTGQLSIRVHVAHKKAASELTPADLFPKEIDGVPVDVLEATYGIQLLPEIDAGLEAAKDGRHQRFDPIPLGVSIGSPLVTAGTLGAKVYDPDTRNEMILSNWHVLVGQPTAQPGAPVWQPGKLDGGGNQDTIAELSRSVLGPYDAAVARITGPRSVQESTLEGHSIQAMAAPRLGMQVWKSGRTTGYTTGFIDGVQMITQLNYGAAGVQQLSAVFRVVPLPGTPPAEISMGGDSGSVWVDAVTGYAVGLHFAGEVGDALEYALAHDMEKVAQHLRVVFPAALPPLPPEPPIVHLPEPPEPPEPPVVNLPDPTPPSAPPVEPNLPVGPPKRATPVTPPPPTSWWDRLMAWLRGLFD